MMIILESKLFFRRLRGIFMAFYRTFQAARALRSCSKRNLAWNHPEVQAISSNWGKYVLKYFNIDVEIEGKPTDKPAIYVANHISYLDIVSLLSVQHLCFVAKSEVGSWPIIGEATKAIGCVFVKRDSARSRSHTAESIAQAVKHESKSICIYPEGTTSIQGKNWRRGVFKVACENELWVQPMGYAYTPVRRAAYIDDDTLIPHMYGLVRNDKTKLKLKYFEARKITDADKDMKSIEAEVRTWADEELKKQNYFDSPVGYI